MASKKVEKKEEEDAPKTVALDAGDLKLLQTYGVGPYTRAIKTLESGITEEMKKIVDLIGALPLRFPAPCPLLGGACRCRGKMACMLVCPTHPPHTHLPVPAPTRWPPLQA
jgi:hypothetical protein